MDSTPPNRGSAAPKINDQNQVSLPLETSDIHVASPSVNNLPFHVQAALFRASEQLHYSNTAFPNSTSPGRFQNPHKAVMNSNTSMPPAQHSERHSFQRHDSQNSPQRLNSGEPRVLPADVFGFTVSSSSLPPRSPSHPTPSRQPQHISPGNPRGRENPEKLPFPQHASSGVSNTAMPAFPAPMTGIPGTYPHHDQLRRLIPPPHRQLYNPAGLPQPIQGDQRQYDRHQQSFIQSEYLMHMLARVKKSGISQEELIANDSFRKRLEQICNSSISDYVKGTKEVGYVKGTKEVNDVKLKIKLKCYGSLANGFALPGSDMDLLLVFSTDLGPAQPQIEEKSRRILEKTLLDMGIGARLLIKTRVPILRVCETPTLELLTSLREERKKWEDEDSKPHDIDSKPTASDRQKPPDSTAAASRTGFQENPKPRPDQDMEVKQQAQQAIPESLGQSTLLGEGQQSATAKGQSSTDVQDAMAAITIQDTAEAPVTQLNVPGPPSTLDSKVYRDVSHLEFPKTGVGIHCDINFSNFIAIQNTHLLKCYCLCDSRVREMGLFVKTWAKVRKINSPYHGTLSSYGYILMVLHFLINVANPPVIPNLQLAGREVLSVDGHDVCFWGNEKDIIEAARRKRLTANRENVGSLLRGFFQYYATQGRFTPSGGFSWTQSIISIRIVGGILPKGPKGWTETKTTDNGIRLRYLLAIEDPFEIDHNIARTVVHGGIVAIRDEFRRAHKILCRIEDVPGRGWIWWDDDGLGEDIFAEAEDKLDLQKPRIPPEKSQDGGPSDPSKRNQDGAKKPSNPKVGDGVLQPANGKRGSFPNGQKKSQICDAEKRATSQKKQTKSTANGILESTKSVEESTKSVEESTKKEGMPRTPKSEEENERKAKKPMTEAARAKWEAKKQRWKNEAFERKEAAAAAINAEKSSKTSRAQTSIQPSSPTPLQTPITLPERAAMTPLPNWGGANQHSPVNPSAYRKAPLGPSTATTIPPQPQIHQAPKDSSYTDLPFPLDPLQLKAIAQLQAEVMEERRLQKSTKGSSGTRTTGWYRDLDTVFDGTDEENNPDGVGNEEGFCELPFCGRDD